MEFRREGQIVRDGNHEATLYFFGFPGEEVELELTYNTDGRSYELGTAYGHIAVRVDDMDATLSELAGQGIEPEKRRTRSARAAASSASSRTPTATASS